MLDPMASLRNPTDEDVTKDAWKGPAKAWLDLKRAEDKWRLEAGQKPDWSWLDLQQHLKETAPDLPLPPKKTLRELVKNHGTKAKAQAGANAALGASG